MPRLWLAKQFMPRYAKLEKHVQKAVDATLDKFQEHTHAGVHLEKQEGQKDPNLRTIRITLFWRGVVLAPERGDDFYLITVLPHDDAIAFATRRQVSVNQALGVLELWDRGGVDDFEPALKAASAQAESLLFDHVKDKELVRLGISEELLPVVRLLSSEAHLNAMETVLPEAQYNVLLGLATGLTPEQVWAEVAAKVAEVPEEVDTEDFAAAAARTPDEYALISGPEELTAILANPFAAWRTFLHPNQESVAFRSFRGPTLVSGGPGTGKTVTIVHRAVHLAGTLSVPDKVLVTTFNRGLADALEEQLRLLTDDQHVLSRIDVINVDRLANRIVADAHGRSPNIVDRSTLSWLWERASQSIAHEFSPTFLQREWEQVILAQDIRDRDAYQRCKRRGRGRRIGDRQKELIWEAVNSVVEELRRLGKMTYTQVLVEAEEILVRQGRTPYRHVLVDEGQDLHPAAWRLLRESVAAGPDDMFIVADPNQRIYDNRVSLGSLNIRIHNRSYKLTVNYRTTQEILSWSARTLDDQPAEGLDDQTDTLAGFNSPMHGKRPVQRAFSNWHAELDGLVGQIQEWRSHGVEESSIGIATRTGVLVNDVRRALEEAGIAHARKDNGVRVDTMHAMKGHEFQCVAIVGLSHENFPQQVAITSRDEDPVSHQHDIQRERCLLFVTSSRPRDMLYVSYAGTPSPFLPA